MSKTDLMLYGKLQPQAIEIEEMIIGAMLIERDACISALNLLREEMFYSPVNALVFKAISSLFLAHAPVDIGTVTNQLKKEGNIEKVGGAFGVAEFTNRVGSSANTEYHCLIIQQKYLGREIIRISSIAIKDGYEETTDILELINTTAKNILKLAQIEGDRDISPVIRVNKALNQMRLAKETGNAITGIKSGLYSIDKITGGWQNQDLIIIAARPGAGKSALAINFASDSGVPTLFFSLEMSDEQIALREMGRGAKLKYTKMRKGEVDSMEFEAAHQQGQLIADGQLYVDSSSKLTIQILRTKLLKAIYEKGIKLVVIDYLNLMEGEQNRNQTTADKISEIVKELKRLAKTLNIPIILLAQLNREVEATESKKPELHHLKSSGAIEEYADMVLLLYRPAYYFKGDFKDCPEPNKLVIKIAKHKQGGTGEVECYCEIDKNIIRDE